MNYLIDYDIVTKNDIKDHKKYLFELRRHHKQWSTAGNVDVVLQDFIERGIITEEEYFQD